MGHALPRPPWHVVTDPLQPLDDPDRPTYTIGQAAELLGVQVAFLRSLDTAGVVEPARSAGGHRRWSRRQLRVAARIRVLVDDGHPLVSAELIVTLQDEAAHLRDELSTRPPA